MPEGGGSQQTSACYSLTAVLGFICALKPHHHSVGSPLLRSVHTASDKRNSVVMSSWALVFRLLATNMNIILKKKKKTTPF